MNLVKQFLKEFKISKQNDVEYDEHYNHDNYDPNTDEIGHYGKFSHFEVTSHSICKTHIPHFHLTNLKTGNETFIKILEPEYCEHNEKNTLLTNDEIDDLIQWLNAPEECLPKITHFTCIYRMWNLDYPDNQVEYGIEMPDYIKLKTI